MILCFKLTKDELDDWRSQLATSNREIMGLRVLSFAFTEHGILMLSNVLKSDKAASMSIQIIRVFVKMREMIMTNKDFLLKFEEFEKRLGTHEMDINQLYQMIKELIGQETQPLQPIGFKINNHTSEETE